MEIRNSWILKDTMKKYLLPMSMLMSAICFVGTFSTAMLCNDFQPNSSYDLLTNTEASDLQYALEEIKLARDLYLALNNRFENQVFSDLPKAEAHQLGVVQQLCGTYGLPARVEAPGEFRNEALNKRYDELITQGLKSHRNALLVGALVEELAVSDFRDASRRTNRDDLHIMYERLYGSSIRHFRSVVAAFESRTEEKYTPQKLSAHTVNSILGR